jgi:hydrogenase-4 component B
MPDILLILFLVMLAAYGFGALAALISTRAAACRALSAVGAVVGAGAGVALGALVLIERTPFMVTLLDLLPLTGAAMRIDGLGAFFLVIIGLVGGAAAIYGFGYSAAYTGRYSLRLLGAMFNLLLLALSVQVMADNALTFLIAWEGMSLAAYWLVLT